MKTLRTDNDMLCIENGIMTYYEKLNGVLTLKNRVEISENMEFLLTRKASDGEKKNVSETVAVKKPDTMQGPEKTASKKPVKKSKPVKKKSRRSTNYQTVFKTVCKKNHNSVLGMMKVTQKDRMCILQATNNDVYVSYNTDIRYIDEPFLVSPEDFFNLLNKTGQNNIKKINDNTISVNGSELYAYFIVEDFPENFAEKAEFKNTADIQIKTVEKVMYAASTDTIKPVFNGLFFDGKNLCATDSRRLAVTQLKAEGSFNEIIPLNTIKLIKSDFFYASTNKKEYCKINVNGIVIYSRLIEGQFPNYKRVIPDGDPIQDFTADISSIKDKLKTVVKMTREPAYKMVFSLTKNKILITTNKNGVETNFNHDIECYTPEENMKIGINAKFLYDVLSHSDKCEVIIRGAMSPIVFDDNETLHVVMPIQIKEPEDD